MADTSSDTQTRDLYSRTAIAKIKERQDSGVSGAIDAPLPKQKLAAKLRSSTAPVLQSDRSSHHGNHDDSGHDHGNPLEAPIDPLSQHIFKRTNTAPVVPKLRSQNTEPVNHTLPTTPNEPHSDKRRSSEANRHAGDGPSKGQKKKVSFLSRFIGSSKKKPDIASEDGSEAESLRQEGIDAPLYVNNFSFSPKVPQSPAYIKVRAKFKAKKEFDHVFLAQKLLSGSEKRGPRAVGSNGARQSGSAAAHNPIWAAEFSKDGRYLAVGGQDRVVRVWAVIASPEDRRAHESAEHDPQAHHVDTKHLSAPVFQHKTYREYHGHTSTILDLSWSKNNFLLSSSMDKTVRLWHVSRNENLCTFKHSDFVPSVQFHPADDRFFLAGSLDSKLRLWSIPDKSVAYSTTVPEMITAVAFSPDGKTSIAGTLGGLCVFYDTEGLKWQGQLHAKSTRGQNARGSKITGIRTCYWPPESTSGPVKLLVSSNDSRLRVYNMRDKTLEMKLKGHENNCSQIRASFADSGDHIICGSEDRKTYIWSITTPECDKRNQLPMEVFEAHNSITTCTIIAPASTKRLLGASEDPIFDLCNPPPVTLVSRAESIISSRAPTDVGPTPSTPAFRDKHGQVVESPAYLNRSAHRGGNIIVTADYTGALKVFRQDCASAKRTRMSESWGNTSTKRSGSMVSQPSSSIFRGTRTRGDSTSTQSPNDHIMRWRQGIFSGSFDSTSSAASTRPGSPRKSLASLGRQLTKSSDSPTPLAHITSAHPDSHPSPGTPNTHSTMESTFSTSASARTDSQPSSTPCDPSLIRQVSASNPMAVYNGQSWLFWSTAAQKNVPVPTVSLGRGLDGAGAGADGRLGQEARGETGESEVRRWASHESIDAETETKRDGQAEMWSGGEDSEDDA